MILTFCDRCGRPAQAFALTWFNGRSTVSSVLCEKCQSKLQEWFGDGNPDPKQVRISALELQSAVPIEVTVLNEEPVA